MEAAFRERLSRIRPVDASLARAGQAHLDDLTKPKGSLGRLEELALRQYLIGGGANPAPDPAVFFICAGDHGVAAEGVSAFPQAVTRQMVGNFLAGGAAMNALSRQAGAALKVVDAGCAGGEFDEHPLLVRAKVAAGTANLAAGPAMSRAQCLAALATGFDLAEKARSEGFATVGTGDMGIANTTPSTALYCAFLGLDPARAAGPGTGLDPEGVARKAAVVRRGLEANASAVASGDAVDILAALGGFEIACLAGIILGGAAGRQNVLVDGFISGAALVAAWKIEPAVMDYVFFSHASAEPGHAAAMERLGARPLLDLGLRLGEGTGGVLALQLLRASAAVFNEMATFSSAGVSKE